MGVFFRKRNKNGVNISVSSAGLRISKTVKFGNMSFNLGHYFGGSRDGKTTGRVTGTAGNGLGYRKDFSLGNKSKVNFNKDPLPKLTQTLGMDFIPSDVDYRRKETLAEKMGDFLFLLPFIGFGMMCLILWVMIFTSFNPFFYGLPDIVKRVVFFFTSLVFLVPAFYFYIEVWDKESPGGGGVAVLGLLNLLMLLIGFGVMWAAFA
jgi:hypothetical protein